MYIASLFTQAGVMKYPILICSIVGLAIIIEKFLVLYVFTFRRSTYERLKVQLLEHGPAKTADLLGVKSDPISRLFRKVLTHTHQTEAHLQEAIQTETAALSQYWDRYLNYLFALISIAPMLGLFGTVIGLIRIFRAFSIGAEGQLVLLSSGISIALITTAAGIGLAIPFTLFFHIYTRRVEENLLRVESAVNDLYESANRGDGHRH
ncbi:MAG: MotA/TolQ/ExbB proton channel family protein [Candidatus Margulisiibacteriota bacterium]|jgi:biopolymer transport protein ExbB